jgi:uncharacterized membrane protein
MAFLKSKWFWLGTIILLWLIGGFELVCEVYGAALPGEKAQVAIRTAFLILGGLGVVLPTYLNVWQSLEAGKQISDKIRFDKIENTYRLIEKFDDPSAIAARFLCREVQDQKLHLSDADLIKRIKDDDKLRDSVTQVFNYWENVRISIKYDRVNMQMLRDSLAPPFNRQFDTFKPWIDIRGEDFKTDFYWLKKQWQP